MNQAAHIIQKFGGLHPLARALGHRNASTVQGWKERGTIPTAHHKALLEAAERSGVALTYADFFEFGGSGPTPSQAAE